MVVAHRAIRQDLRRLAACVAAIPGHGAPPSQARAIGRYTAALLAEILAHHENEDEVLWPVIAATAGQAVDLAPLTDDHRAIEAAVGRAGQALVSFRAEPGTPAELHASLTELRDMLDEHITDEEEQIIPAMRRYLPAEAYRWCEKQIQRKAPLTGIWFTAPWLARYAQPDQLSRRLATGGWPARILLAATRPGYARLERRAFGAVPSMTAATRPIPHSDHYEEETMTGRTGTLPGRREWSASQSRGPAENDADTVTSTAAIIGLAGVQKTYRSAGGRGGGPGVGFRALNGVDLAIATGEMVAITGPSGSGKTTIINLIAGIDRPTAGTVTVNGSRLDQMTEEQLAVWRGRTIGIVFQFFQLMPTLTAAENATLPLDLARRGAARERKAVASRHLATVGLGDRGDRLPTELSGGEQQRVAIARAMACQPPILLGDEPTGNLDTAMARDMFELLKGLNENGTTVVYVTHDQSLAALASRIVSVRDGLITGDTGRRP
jgi:putative ABC transport system ATP-binding protein